ncbi:MAG TPA: rhamnulokinase family protein [Tepidisphaeraceae bacterium]|jgi:sugar (pentulose or hexulose) kinase
MADGKYLAFDIGAESGRAMLGTLTGGKLTLEEKHRFANPNGRLNGRMQWNLLGQWEQVKTGLKNCRGTKLDGIGVDTWGVDFGLLGTNGELLGNPVMYRDPRTHGMLAAALKIASKEEIFQATGVQLMEINSLYQILSMVRAKSPVLDVAETLLFVPDLFNYLLSGVAKAEVSIASTSQMYDPQKKAWATELLAKLGIPAKLLPALVPSGTVLGNLLAEVADECGIAPAPVIATAGHDTASAVVAVPAEGKSWCYISSGTWSLMGVELPGPLINAKTLQYDYTNEGGASGTTRFLKNIMGLWLVQECRRQFAKDGYDHSYSELTGMAGRAKPFAAIIDPDDAPFRLPGMMPQKIAEYCRKTGQPDPGTRGAFVRACLDSLALKYRQTLESLEDVLGRRIDVIHIVGGGAQNELLNQLTADVCERPVIAGPVEATASGNILVQAIATGAVADLTSGRDIIRRSFAVKRYDPKTSATTEAAYERYRSYVKG